jgi:hypothetical protein
MFSPFKNKGSQRGNVLLTLPGILVMAGIAATIAIVNVQLEAESAQEYAVDTMRTELLQVIDGFQTCYDDTRSWCDFSQVISGYGGKDNISVSGRNIDSNVQGLDLKLTYNAETPEYAHRLKRYFKGTSVVGNQITITVNPPTASHIFKSNVQRYNDDAGFERNKSETNWDLDSNNIENVNHLDANKGTIGTYTSNTQTIGRLNINDAITLGPNSISASGNELLIDADITTLSGDTNIAGDVDLLDNNISGINEVTTNQLYSGDLTTNTGTIDNVSGSNINYDTGTVDDVRSQSVTSNNFNTTQLDSETLNTNQLNSNVNSTNADIAQLGFENATGDNWSFQNGSTSNLTTQDSTLGTSSTDDLNIIGRVTAGEYQGGDLVVSTLAVSGNVTGDQFTGTDFRTPISSVNDNHVLLRLNQSQIETNANDIATNSSNSAINTSGISNLEGVVAGNTASISNNTTAINNTSQQIANNSANISQNTSNIARNKSDLAREESELNTLTGQLHNCMYVTQYCIPQDPTASLSCADCSKSSAATSFSATAYGSISDCRQGCTYSWTVSGTGISASGCSSGSVSQGGTAAPSCTVTANLSGGQSASGSITLNVSNSHYTGRTDSASVPVYFLNIKPTVSTSCSGCNDSDSSSSFGGTISGSISGCAAGCNYAWTYSGTGLSFSGCSGGSLTGSASVSCSVSANVDPQDSASGSVTLTATSNTTPSSSDSDSESIYYFNTSPAVTYCPATSASVHIGGAGGYSDTKTFSVPKTAEGGKFYRFSFGGDYGCAGGGTISHTEWELEMACSSSGSWQTLTNYGSCIKD